MTLTLERTYVCLCMRARLVRWIFISYICSCVAHHKTTYSVAVHYWDRQRINCFCFRHNQWERRVYLSNNSECSTFSKSNLKIESETELCSHSNLNFAQDSRRCGAIRFIEMSKVCVWSCQVTDDVCVTDKLRWAQISGKLLWLHRWHVMPTTTYIVVDTMSQRFIFSIILSCKINHNSIY